MKGIDYMIYQKYSKTCIILVQPELAQARSIWLMGDPFLRAYYSIYDLENKRIGLVGIAETTKLEEQPKEETKAGLGNKVEAILNDIGITKENSYVLEIIISAVGLLCCCCCCTCF